MSGRTAAGPSPSPAHLAFHTESQQWGGAESCLAALVAGASTGARRITVLGVSDDVVQRLVRLAPVPADAVLLPARASALDPRPLLPYVRALRRLRPDLLHVNAAFTFGSPYALVAAALTGVPYVVQEHLPLAPGHPRLQVPLKRWTSRRARAHVAVSGRAARETERLARLPAGSVAVVANGVPAQLPTDPQPAPGRPCIVAVGRLTRQKGFDVLLRAVAALPGVHVVLVGDGPERSPLADLARELGVTDRVQVTGWRTDARAWMAGADVVAVPSRFEAGALVLIEALAEGVPIVASDVGSAQEVLDAGRCGAIVPPDDVDALRAALAGVLANPPRARSRALAGRRRYDDLYTEQVMLGRWREVYATALASSQPASSRPASSRPAAS